MKKNLIVVLICLLSLSCLYGCKQNTAETKKETTQNEESSFVKPKEYETVLTVTINPIFRLYLNSDNEVIAIESVNEDAKGIVNDINQETKELDEVIKNIVKCADENNFLKKDATVDVKIVETTSAQDKQAEILVIVKDTVKNNFEGVNVNTSDDIKDNKKEDNNKTDKEQISDDKDNKKEDNNKTNKEQALDDKENHTTQSSMLTHKHQYANATCTQPKKCSCGVTEGSALGHKWANATCQSPQKCITCGEISGSTTEHVFSNGECEICKMKDITNPHDTIKYNISYVSYDSFNDDNMEDNVISELCFASNTLCRAKETWWLETPGIHGSETINYNGKIYYGGDGGGNPFGCRFTENEIVVSDYVENTVFFTLVVQHNGELRVVSSNLERYRVGSVFVQEK